jgi:hypothetical protein
MSAFYTPVFTREHDEETKRQIARENKDKEPHHEQIDVDEEYEE